MTLIIGFKCTHGAALVSDTKITGTTSSSGMALNEDENGDYASKIFQPLPNNPFIVGAAGYTDLFREFNNKIPLIVSQRTAEYNNMNIKALMQLGFTIEAAMRYISQPERPLAPYIYSYENFMDDCKQLVKNISGQLKAENPYPLEVLTAVKKNLNVMPTLHYIDSDGHEQEQERYVAIGSGSPFVEQFFSRLYDFNKNIYELIPLAFLTIAYVKKVARESTVGYSKAYPPEAHAVFNDGRCQALSFPNLKDVLSDLENKVKQYEDLIQKTSITALQSDVPLPTQLVVRVRRLS